MVCIAIEVCLQRQGFNVTIADGGEAGMRALESAEFDVMLVDIFMPHMRGFESIRLFHERAPEIPLIAMSRYAFANAISGIDRKSTRLNSSHLGISYAVFCL